jgi:hypothetical protein
MIKVDHTQSVNKYDEMTKGKLFPMVMGILNNILDLRIVREFIIRG